MPLKSHAKFLFPYIHVLILLSAALTLSGQNYTIRSFTTADGLPHNNVRAIARDSSGFVWVGTWDGLSRFDGHDFRNFYHEPDDSTSIPYFSINELYVDRRNNLWILPDNRVLARYNRNTDNFATVRSLSGISLDFINNINVDQKGNLMILGRENILVKDPDEQSCRLMKLTDFNGNPFIVEGRKNWFSMIGDTMVWVMGTADIREFWKKADDEFVLAAEYRLERKYPRATVHFDFTEWYSYYVSSSGSKWIFSTDGIFRLNEPSGTFREYFDEIPWNEFTGRNFFYWGKRGEGIFFYNNSDRKLVHIPDHQAKWFFALMPGGDDSFWFSNITSYGVAQGLSMVALIPGYFKNTMIESPDSASPAVYSVIMDKDRNIWTGIRGFDHIVQFRPDGSVREKVPLDKETLASAGYLRSMIPVQNGIWIGYYLSLLQFYDYETGRTTVHNAQARSFRTIAINPEGNIYIGTENLSIYYPTTGKTEILLPKLPETGMFRLYADTSGIIWAGMNDSRLLKYDTKTGESSIIRVAQGESNIEDIVRGDNGDLWIALLGKGVCRYNTINGTFRYYTTAKGLSNNTTYALLKDRSGDIWVSTNDGISMINPVTDHIKKFDESDGIAISEFNSGAKFISGDGEFFFGGMGGFTRFNPDSISLQESKANRQKILLTDLRVSGESKHLQGLLNDIDTIILTKGENNFHLFFSSSDFVNSQKTLFRYRLSGINSTWIETGPKNRNINYANLKPAWYNLLIEATDKNGDWTVSRKITIRIKPHFYQTRVFLIIVPLLILAIIDFSIILYIRQIKQRERSKQDELKLHALRSQMNPHFVFNALNSINYFISNNDKLSANRYIADFSRLIRFFLSNMGYDFIPFENEINSISDYLRIEHLRFSDKFDYELDTSEIKNISEYEVCPGIAGPFIENAIWHGLRALENRKGHIKISYLPSGADRLKCIIEDDGIGRYASLKSKGAGENHKPKGISIIEERLQITGKLRKSNYRLAITDLYPEKEETGTKVEVDIPARRIKKRKS